MDKGKKILVVDDEESIVEILSYLLLKNGYKVFSAMDGISAVTLTFREKPDLILLDIMLPGKSGYDVYNEVMAAQRIPVLFVTALGIDKVRESVPNISESRVFTKPWDDKKLLDTIEKVLAANPTTSSI